MRLNSKVQDYLCEFKLSIVTRLCWIKMSRRSWLYIALPVPSQGHDSVVLNQPIMQKSRERLESSLRLKLNSSWSVWVLSLDPDSAVLHKQGLRQKSERSLGCDSSMVSLLYEVSARRTMKGRGAQFRNAPQFCYSGITLENDKSHDCDSNVLLVSEYQVVVRDTVVVHHWDIK